MAKSILRPKVFSLSKVVFNPDGGVTVGWVVKGKEFQMTDKSPAHQDLIELAKSFSKFVGKYYTLPAANVEQLSTKKVNVNNYEDEEGQSVSIQSVFTHDKSLQNTPLKTAKIQTHGDAYGFETELKELIIKLSGEAEAYVFDSKSSQAKMDLVA